MGFAPAGNPVMHTSEGVATSCFLSFFCFLKGRFLLQREAQGGGQTTVDK